MKFSVIMPVYNKADTVCAAVESVYAQTYDDFEIVMVDDGSCDGLEQALESLRSPKLRLIRQENGGVSVARNTGLSNARGEYVCFLDADDLWKPEHLETVAALMKKYPESRAFVTSHAVILPDGQTLHSGDALANYDEDFETDDLLGVLNRTAYSVVHTNSVCAQRSMLEQEGIRFEPGIRIGEDTDVWYRLGLKHKVALTKKETTAYRREFSTATQSGFHVQDWIFSRRGEALLEDEGISEKVKASVTELIDRYNMTSSREYMAAGDRKAAKRVLSQVSNKAGKRYMLTKIFTFLPCCLCRWVLKR